MTRTAETAKPPSLLTRLRDIPGGDRDLIGLARVSTDGQDAQLQRDDLRAPDAAGSTAKRRPAPGKATADRPRPARPRWATWRAW